MERVQIYFKILVKLQFLPISLQFSVVYDSHDKLVQGVQVGHDLGPGHRQHQLRVQQHYNISPPPLVKILLYNDYDNFLSNAKEIEFVNKLNI